LAGKDTLILRAFKREESLMHTEPPGGVKYDLVSLIRMAQLIGDSEKQTLQLQALSCPEISVQRLLVDGGYVPEKMLDSLELGQELIEKGVIKEAQFCVGIFDELTMDLTMKDSLMVRGWLPPDFKTERKQTQTS
jgi:hypothetical protein